MSISFAGGDFDAVTVDTNSTSLTGEIVLGSLATDIVFQIKNTGAAALTALVLEVKATAGSEFVPILSSTAWATLSSALVAVGGTLHTLGAGVAGAAHLRLGPWYSVRLTATCGTSTSVVVRSKVRRQS